jgi:RimJ/RimL family protein N-acetyltransferase
MATQFRPITKEDKQLVIKLGTQAFGPLGAMFVSLETGGWLALSGPELTDLPEGTPIGAIILKKVQIKEESYGVVSWIMTHPKSRGMGLASQLRDKGDQWFIEQGIRKTFAIIEHYNQSSSKLFATKGYQPLSLARQLKLFGGTLLPIWIKSLFMVSLSHVLWYRDVESWDNQVGNWAAVHHQISDPAPSHHIIQKPDTEPSQTKSQQTRAENSTSTTGTYKPPALGFLKSLGFQALVFFLLMARWGAPLPALELLWAAGTVAIIILLARTLPFWLGTTLKGLPTTYTAWSGGSPLVLLVTGVFGGFIPYPGSLYPKESQYKLKEVLPALGFGSFLGALGLLGLFIGVELVNLDPSLPQWLQISHSILKAMVPVYVIVDIMIPTFPFWGYLGRQVFLWKPLAWAGLALTGLGLLIFL